jgi:hypothetical protein
MMNTGVSAAAETVGMIKIASRRKHADSAFRSTLTYYNQSPPASLLSASSTAPSTASSSSSIPVASSVASSTSPVATPPSSASSSVSSDFTCIQEDSECVDGIGGITWEGSLLMAYLLQQYKFLSGTNIVELGAGAGLCSLALADNPNNENINLICTDRFIDLAEVNVKCHQEPHSLSSGIRNVLCLPLTWGNAEEENAVLRSLSESGSINRYADIIIGCEVGCLRAQQNSLVKTILSLSGPDTVVVIGFDEGPQPNHVTAETEFDHKMCSSNGYNKVVICSGSLVWQDREGSDGARSGYLVGFECGYRSANGINASPIVLEGSRGGDFTTVVGKPLDSHVVAYFKPSALRTCSRCQHAYIPQLSRYSLPCPHERGRGDTGCFFHSGYYVCRYHPAETKLSLGSGDGLGYYGNGEEGKMIVTPRYTQEFLLKCLYQDGKPSSGTAAEILMQILMGAL